MTPDLRLGETTRLSRGDRLLLIVVAVPFVSVSSFVAIVYVCELLDYPLFSARDLGLITWSIFQFLASVALILVLSIAEGLRVGGLGVYTILGIGVGGVLFLLVSDAGKGIWILPLQYGLISHLIGRIAYRGVNRPIPDSVSSTSIKHTSGDGKSGENP